MSVLLETSLGDLVFDLHTDMCPLASKNFLKLCQRKYYNNCIFHSVEKDFIAQSGDPTGTGQGGECVYSQLDPEKKKGEKKYFKDEIFDDVKHKNLGTLAMVNKGPDTNGSQFYITLRSGLDFLDGKYTIFGELAEGEEVLERINASYCDKHNRPYRNIRIKHTHILEDPFEEELQPAEEPASPPPARDDRPEADDEIVDEDEMTVAETERANAAAEAKSRAVVLEMIGDIPDAEMKPPENVVFVCKLNPITQDEDLDIIFGRFGPCSSEIIRDRKTGDSLNYAFIEFETQEAAEAAYEKMNNVIIDDRRIKVDFSQSFAKQWKTLKLQQREKLLSKRQERGEHLLSQGGVQTDSSQVVGGNDYQREVIDKWNTNPIQSNKPFNPSVEGKLGGYRDRKEGAPRSAGGGRYDIKSPREEKVKTEVKVEGARTEPSEGREREQDNRDRDRDRGRDTDRRDRDRDRDRSRDRDRDRDRGRDRRERDRSRDRDRERGSRR